MTPRNAAKDFRNRIDRIRPLGLRTSALYAVAPPRGGGSALTRDPDYRNTTPAALRRQMTIIRTRLIYEAIQKWTREV